MMAICRLPISELETFRKNMASKGKFYRIRYRGPRNTVHDIGRNRNSRASTCLKINAVYFAAYPY